MSRLLRDHVRIGTQAEVSSAIVSIADRLSAISAWIKNNLDRTDDNLIVINIIARSEEFLRISLGAAHISILALSTRSLYEIDGRLRSILGSEESLSRWKSEAITDKIQFLEGLLHMEAVDSAGTARAVIQSEIARLHILREKWNLPSVKRPSSAMEIAREAGTESEHKALFSLLSKLIHPSSLLVNSFETANSSEMRSILQIHLQLYAWDLIWRLSDHLKLPDRLVVPRGSAH